MNPAVFFDSKRRSFDAGAASLELLSAGEAGSDVGVGADVDAVSCSAGVASTGADDSLVGPAVASGADGAGSLAGAGSVDSVVRSSEVDASEEGVEGCGAAVALPPVVVEASDPSTFSSSEPLSADATGSNGLFVGSDAAVPSVVDVVGTVEVSVDADVVAGVGAAGVVVDGIDADAVGVTVAAEVSMFSETVAGVAAAAVGMPVTAVGLTPTCELTLSICLEPVSEFDVSVAFVSPGGVAPDARASASLNVMVASFASCDALVETFDSGIVFDDADATVMFDSADSVLPLPAVPVDEPAPHAESNTLSERIRLGSRGNRELVLHTFESGTAAPSWRSLSQRELCRALIVRAPVGELPGAAFATPAQGRVSDRWAGTSDVNC